MRVIGVVDLRGGQAVHAIAGDRERYVPVRSIAGRAIEAGDPLTLSRAYHESLGINELYVADLDALAGRASQDDVIGRLAGADITPRRRSGCPERSSKDKGRSPAGSFEQSVIEPYHMRMWLDAGITSAEGAWHVCRLGAAHVIVALETLTSYEALTAICGELGGCRVAFSLDLSNGRPMLTDTPLIMDEPPHTVAARARDAGVGAIIVIDVARVGTATGLDFALLNHVRHAVPDLTLVAGGGVREREDLVRLADLGCDAALVATALHTGIISASDIATVARRGSGSAGV